MNEQNQCHKQDGHDDDDGDDAVDDGDHNDDKVIMFRRFSR